MIADSKMYPWFAFNDYLCFRLDLAILCLTAVACSWLLTHTAYTLRYARPYYRDDEEGAGGLEFPGGRPPDDFDFAYFAFTVGMCFQVSDVVIATSRAGMAHGRAVNAVPKAFLISSCREWSIRSSGALLLTYSQRAAYDWRCAGAMFRRSMDHRCVPEIALVCDGEIRVG